MGLVRRARDTVLHRDVAVKLLADNLAADEDARERFLREARAAARINHPHVVVVHDVAEADGRPYLVMELVDGPSLADVLRHDGPLAPDEVVAVAAQALAGLAAAHTAGVLHRDVKPANLLRAPDGDVKVADFGVAEAADVPGLTRTGFVLGTRSYLAPERLRGAPASVRTDLYALGATLTELSTGAPPTDTPAAAVTAAPAGLRRLVERLTASDPQGRPVSAEQALLDLAHGDGQFAADTVALAVADLDPGPTRPLPADTSRRAAPTTGIAPTVALAPDAGAAPTTPLGPDETGSTTAATAAGDATGTADRSRLWQLLMLIALAVVAVAVLVRLVDGAAETPAVGETGESGDPEVQDPDANATDAARDLARWLRERADD